MTNELTRLRILIGVLILSATGFPAGSLVAEADAPPAEEWVDPQEVLELGRKGDKSDVRYLRRVKSRPERQRNSAAVNAQMALARLGERTEIEEIIAESKSEDPAVQSFAIEKLGYVANREAVRALVVLLDDRMGYRRGRWKGRDGKWRVSDEGFSPPSLLAMKALAQFIPDPPRFKKKHPSKEDVAAWKAWWKKNRQKYE